MPSTLSIEQIIFFCLLTFTVLLVVFGLGVLRGRRGERSVGSTAGVQLTQQIIEAAPIGICIIRERRFAFVNDVYYRMFGYESADEILGRFVEELYAEEERERQRTYSRDRVAGKPVPTMYETVGLRKNGEKFEVSAWVSLIRYLGQPCSLGFIIDRSVETEMRRKLDQANRLEAVGTLAGGIAHDFNNILTAIIGYSELALLRSKDDQRTRTDLQQVLKAGKRAKDLIRQILSFSRQQDQSTRVVQMSVVVDEVVRLVGAILPASIAMKVECGSDVKILADPTSIHQLIMNLCTNAEHAMRKTGGTLTIEVAHYIAGQGTAEEYPGLTPGKYGMLKVCDTGKGISPEIVEKIYEPFFTTKNVGEGTGMGLSQVHAIVRSHKGYISFSDNVPHGTVFTVFFPEAESEEIASAETIQPRLTHGSGKILLVDDEPMVLEVIQRTLLELGYEVTACSEAQEALSLFEQNPNGYDLVVSDMTMPNMNGDELAVKLKALRPSLPVVLCSGYSAAIEENPHLKAIVTILEKPVDRAVLADTLNRKLEQNRSS
ncbi:ATP-binding protein [Desulfopila sp. IMCC35008]|uniref:hybrid sensor histidine kinase/response regulator n=1 Tax=Desulfopila sp. IMCC35008 TaxID=2653858 RepID=UPI0013D13288|nr:ATP-binding protein [Desulfopila sp. IMCC35008]